ncbi:hypothetical protein [Nocardia asiatica]|uniref:hypothetical protein n=1 Tax=Nocardia asiatica TaxID=209252 RepID=UPI0003199512|nr:hypothetical protein [Nocardia asiatica]
MIPVVRLAPGNQWDQNLLDRLFANQLYPTGLEFERFDAYVKADGIVLIVPGRYWAGHEHEISEALSRYRWVLAIRTSDEEDLFDIKALQHPNLRWWVQTPRTDEDYGTARLIPLGFPPHFNDLGEMPERTVEVFLSAQNTHTRRVEAFSALARDNHVQRVTATEGFTQGLHPEEYARQMCGAKVAPAPSGAFSPDSFRLYEALEAHTVPIADDISPAYDSAGYWERLFPGAPFPILRDYADLPGYITDVLSDYPRIANRAAAWWMGHKRGLARALRKDLEDLGALSA